MSFLAIPIRTYGRTDPSWWNALRTAGAALESLLGAALIAATDFTITNNQAVAANVTGLTFDPTAVRGFTAEYTIYRKTTSTGATELAEKGTLIGVYSSVAGTWEMTTGLVVGAAGVTFTITNGGQVKYTSTSITGSASVSKMTFVARTIAQ